MISYVRHKLASRYLSALWQFNVLSYHFVSYNSIVDKSRSHVCVWLPS